MKSFGKRPAAILAAGSFALAMTSCQQPTAQNISTPSTSPLGQFWTQLFGKASPAIRGGFGDSAPHNSSSHPAEEDEIEERSGAGG
jgi:hypothetical protein